MLYSVLNIAGREKLLYSVQHIAGRIFQIFFAMWQLIIRPRVQMIG